MPKSDLTAIMTALNEIDRSLLAARLKLARLRKFPNAKAASDAIIAEHGQGKSSRAYQTHESGDRQPKTRELVAYAQTFDVPLEYFAFGQHPEISDEEIEAQALLTRRRLLKRKGGVEPEPRMPVLSVNGDNPVASGSPVNQIRRGFETNTIHNIAVRFIPVLSASEIRRLIVTGRGDLTAMSGEQLPVPQTLSASEHSYTYQIPGNDLSMISANGTSYAPGTYVVCDPEAVILPGKYVLAMLEGFDEPLFRIYKAAKPYSHGVPFALQALNPAYDLITVKDPARVQSVLRVIFTASAV
jgi:Peptidase S24-like